LARLGRAVAEGTRLQLLAVGPFLVAFGWVAPTAIPALFGPAWAPAAIVYPFIALSYMANAMFSLHSSALYVLQRNWAVTVFHLLHIALFAGTALVLVPKIGVIGYGLAEVAALPAYTIVHRAVQRHVGVLTYGLAAAWALGFGLALFYRWLGWWSVIGLAAAMAWPQTWTELSTTVRRVVRVGDAA